MCDFVVLRYFICGKLVPNYLHQPYSPHILILWHWNILNCFYITDIHFDVLYLFSIITDLLVLHFCHKIPRDKSKRFKHSGSMITAKGNIEHMLKEHERNIQEAVRKARINKSREL